MKKFIVATTLVVSTTAMAWGPREQGALIGLAIGLGVQQHQYQVAPPPVVYVPPQQICGYNVYCGEVRREIYVSPVCHIETRYDQYGRVIGTYQVCR